LQIILGMPKLYLLGGENVFNRTAKEVNERAFQDAGTPLVVAIFAWARASFDRDYKKRANLTDYFTSLGANTVEFIEYSYPKELIAQKIASSNLIYLTGGLVTALVERLKRMGVDDLLRSYHGVIVGRSAGALVLCRKCIITNRRSKAVSLIDGLGLTNFTLKAHYKPQNDETLILLSNQQPIYAVPARSALVYENGKLSLMGKAFLFNKGVKQELRP
jgi:peptidase E